MPSASLVHMTPSPGIGTLNHESDQSMVFSCGAGTAGLRLNSVPAMDNRQFPQRWQAVLLSLQGFEEVTGNNDQSPTSGLRPATGLADRNRLDVSGVNHSARPTHPSESTAANRKSTLQVLPSRHVFSNPDVKNGSIKSGDTALQPQISSDRNDKVTKKGTKADSIETISAPNPQSPLTATIVPLVVLPSRADKPSRQAPLSPVLTDSTAKSSCIQFDGRATTAINAVTDAHDGSSTIPVPTPGAEHAGDPSSASVPSLTASMDADAEIVDADQPVTAPPMKPAEVQVDPSIASPPPSHSRSNGQTNSEPASTAIETSRLPIAPLDRSFEQGNETVVPSGAALAPKNAQGDPLAIREKAMPSRPKLELGSSAMRLPVAGAAPQGLGDDRAGQSAVVSEAGIVQGRGNGSDMAATAGFAPMREPFAAIDAGVENSAAKWVVAEGHRAEAGFQDSSLGWVSVRAQTGAGGIHAAVVPSSEVAAQALSAHLAGLNAHMANRYERLNPVTVSDPDAGPSSRDTGREMSHESGAGTSQEGQQRPATGNPETIQVQPAAQVPRGFAEDLRSSVPTQTLTAGSNRIVGHVSFVV